MFSFIGKKWSLVAVCIPFIGGWLLLVFAQNSAMFLIGRFVTGLSSIILLHSKWCYVSKLSSLSFDNEIKWSNLAELYMFLGFSGGLFVLAAPAYSSEIAETKYRGALGAMMQLMICCGILFINLNCTTDWKGDINPILHHSIFISITNLSAATSSLPYTPSNTPPNIHLLLP